MKKNKPLVSVITVTYNLICAGREKMFRKCVESVHRQSYKNIEQIVVDGCSTDGTINLIDEYVKKDWVRSISEKDYGIYDAMNKGISMASGKYINFLNSDDYFRKRDGIRDSVDAMELNDADFSYAPARVINWDGSKYCAKYYGRSPKKKSVFWVMPFCHQTMLVKKEVLVRLGKFNIVYFSAGDYDLVLRMCLDGCKSVYVGNRFVTYRMGGLSYSNQDQSLREIAMIYERNYGSNLIKLRNDEYKMIYDHGYGGIPVKLANKLRRYKNYFDYNEYLKYIDGCRIDLARLKKKWWWKYIEKL